MSFYDAIRIGSSGDAGFKVERSLRVNDDDSAYLNRTPSSTSNRKTFTVSWWFKIGNLGTVRAFFGAYDNSTSGNDGYYFSMHGILHGERQIEFFEIQVLGIIVFLLLTQLNQLVLTELKFI